MSSAEAERACSTAFAERSMDRQRVDDGAQPVGESVRHDLGRVRLGRDGPSAVEQLDRLDVGWTQALEGEPDAIQASIVDR